MGPQDVANAAAVLADAAPIPMDDGEPAFAEPWEGRVFATAVDVVARSGLGWEAFRTRLVVAITDDPHRPYYESWVIALEALALDVGAVSAEDLVRERGHASSYRYHEHGLGDVEVFPLRLADDLPAIGATLDLAVPFDLGICRHAERYRIVNIGGGVVGEWRFRAFDELDAVVVDVAIPAGPDVGLSGGPRPSGRG